METIEPGGHHSPVCFYWEVVMTGDDKAYIDIVRMALTDCGNQRALYWPLRRPTRLLSRMIFDLLTWVLRSKDITLASNVRGEGSEWPPTLASGWLDATPALTLMGEQRLDHLQWCVEECAAP